MSLQVQVQLPLLVEVKKADDFALGFPGIAHPDATFQRVAVKDVAPMPECLPHKEGKSVMAHRPPDYCCLRVKCAQLLHATMNARESARRAEVRARRGGRVL